MNQLLEVLESHCSKIAVTIPKDSNCESFWYDLANDMYYTSTLERMGIDHKIREQMREFAKVDSLDLLTRAGRILKRFARFYKKQTGEQLSNEVLGIIGDRLQYYVNKKEQKDFVVDFTNSIDWDDGSFGKRDSCWWGTYRDSIPTFEQGGGWAIRFYSDMDDRRGIGRTWIVPQDGVLVCFNSYGIERPDVSKVIKSIFSLHGIILHYQRVRVENSQNSEIPYINDESGFVLYPEGVDPSDSYDLDMDVIRTSRCEHCNTRLDDEYNHIGDSDYCQICTDRLFSYCDRCEEYCSADDVHSVNHNRYDAICRYCANAMDLSLCESCRTYDNCINTDDSGNDFCLSCQDNLFHCDECDEWYENRDSCESCEKRAERQAESSDFERDFISSELESVTVGDSQVLTMVYRHEKINGLIVLSQDDRFYGVMHESSGLYVRSGIKGLLRSILLMEQLAFITDWSRDKDSLTNDSDVMTATSQVVRNYAY